MDGFSNLSELYNRVKPALKSKSLDFKRLGIYNIEINDIWNYLKNNKWNKCKNLSLADIVDDIMSISFEEINEYLIKKNTGE